MEGAAPGPGDASPEASVDSRKGQREAISLCVTLHTIFLSIYLARQSYASGCSSTFHSYNSTV
jgi:hypothetical protein